MEENNSWDVFISHASEDKYFANRVAFLLKEAGLKVWYDTYILKIGDSLTEQINHGLANSNYGIVIMSRNFFAKEWPKRELGALFNIEMDNKKVILPIWHDITKEEIKKISPLLLDKLASNSEKDGVDKIVQDLLGVIKPETYDPHIHSQIFSTKYANNSEMVFLPLRPYNGYAIAVSKYPVTNKQYKRFIEQVDTNISAKLNHVFAKDLQGYKIKKFTKPKGKILQNGKWVGPFCPWDNEQFNDDDQPVVCISLIEALGYTYWLNTLSDCELSNAILPSEYLWDYAAMGLNHYSIGQLYSSPWRTQTKSIHHISTSPIDVLNEGERINSRGISDMFGNVWEWTSAAKKAAIASLVEEHSVYMTSSAVKGGGYLDNLNKTGMEFSPSLHLSRLKDGIFTKHSDLGFRTALLTKVDNLSADTKKYLWASLENSKRFVEDYFGDNGEGSFYDFKIKK